MYTSFAVMAAVSSHYASSKVLGQAALASLRLLDISLRLGGEKSQLPRLAHVPFKFGMTRSSRVDLLNTCLFCFLPSFLGMLRETSSLDPNLKITFTDEEQAFVAIIIETGLDGKEQLCEGASALLLQSLKGGGGVQTRGRFINKCLCVFTQIRVHTCLCSMHRVDVLFLD